MNASRVFAASVALAIASSLGACDDSSQSTSACGYVSLEPSVGYAPFIAVGVGGWYAPGDTWVPDGTGGGWVDGTWDDGSTDDPAWDDTPDDPGTGADDPNGTGDNGSSGDNGGDSTGSSSGDTTQSAHILSSTPPDATGCYRCDVACVVATSTTQVAEGVSGGSYERACRGAAAFIEQNASRVGGAVIACARIDVSANRTTAVPTVAASADAGVDARTN